MAGISSEIIKRARSMWLSGRYDSDDDIARELNISPSSIRYWRKKEDWHADAVRIEESRQRELEREFSELALDWQRKIQKGWEVAFMHIMQRLAAAEEGADGVKKLKSLAVNDIDVLTRCLGRAHDGMNKSLGLDKKRDENKEIVIEWTPLAQHVRDKVAPEIGEPDDQAPGSAP